MNICYVSLCIQYTHTYIHVYIYIYTYTDIYVYLCMCLYTYIYTIYPCSPLPRPLKTGVPQNGPLILPGHLARSAQAGGSLHSFLRRRVDRGPKGHINLRIL